MTSAIFTAGRPLTEPEFLALGETPERIELFDGSLHVTPAPVPLHQHISSELYVALRTGARKAGLHVLEAVNVRLRPDRIPIPDLVVTTDIDYREKVVDAGAVRLICEILSPSNASTDRVLKMHYYATAGIRWYLLIEPEVVTLHLYELVDGTYSEHSVAKVGDILELADPLVASIDPAELLPPG